METENKVLLVVDGNSLLNREYYGVPLLSTQSGIYTNGVMGFTNKLLKYIEKLSPAYRFVAFDLRAPTFRHIAYEGYKASRKGMPEELAMQLPYAKEVCEILGFSVVSKEGFEADDILGTLSKNAEKLGDMSSYLLTGDRDALQLVSDKTTVLFNTNNAVVEYTPEKILEVYGISPEKLIDVKALMGDTSDEIPGVKGIGGKTALKLIIENDSLDGVYNNLDNGTLKITPANRQKLIDGRDNAYLSQKLATICCDVADVFISDANKTDIDKIDKIKLYDFCKKLELNSIIKRLDLKGINPDISDINNAEFSLQEYTEIKAHDIYNKFEKDSVLFVTFNFDFDIVYINNHEQYYKINYENLSEFASLLSGEYKICTNRTKDIYIRFMQKNINITPDFIFDFELAGYVLDPAENSYKIVDLLAKYLNFELADTGDIIENQLYYDLYNILCDDIKRLELERLYYDIELPLALTLAEMEHTGFLIDRDGIEDYGEILDKKASAIQSLIYDMSGTEFNINSPKQLGEILFERLNLPYGKKNKTGYSTNIDVMEKLKPLHPIIQQILDYRAMTKLKSTYCDGMIKLVDEWNRRLHTSFNQTITTTGRLSSTEPNLQNIPIRTQLGKEIRKFFIAEDDYILVDADYSQIELRVLAHISGDETLINAFNNNMDIHRLTASQVFGVSEEDVTPEMRSNAKAVNFGIVYGISDFSLSEDIGVSVLEARRYIEGYFEKYPKVKEFMKDIVDYAYENGYVKTMFNRIRYIRELKNPNKNIMSFGERIARNTPIQGSAADIIKLAMIACDKKFKKANLKSRLILQVHDELIIEAHKDEVDIVKEIIKTEMENVCKMSVPLVADISSGKSWYDAKG